MRFDAYEGCEELTKVCASIAPNAFVSQIRETAALMPKGKQWRKCTGHSEQYGWLGRWKYMVIVGSGHCISCGGRMAEIGVGESLRGVVDAVSMSVLVASGYLQVGLQDLRKRLTSYSKITR